ncbi:MAG: hypothetical protein RE469_08800 [Cuniculiplasma divulgatum]|nr:MAG: hypothetical protein RE469_08800 [Cuniculiplasma divulgatum]
MNFIDQVELSQSGKLLEKYGDTGISVVSAPPCVSYKLSSLEIRAFLLKNYNSISLAAWKIFSLESGRGC